MSVGKFLPIHVQGPPGHGERLHSCAAQLVLCLFFSPLILIQNLLAQSM